MHSGVQKALKCCRKIMVRYNLTATQLLPYIEEKTKYPSPAALELRSLLIRIDRCRNEDITNIPEGNFLHLRDGYCFDRQKLAETILRDTNWMVNPYDPRECLFDAREIYEFLTSFDGAIRQQLEEVMMPWIKQEKNKLAEIMGAFHVHEMMGQLGYLIYALTGDDWHSSAPVSALHDALKKKLAPVKNHPAISELYDRPNQLTARKLLALYYGFQPHPTLPAKITTTPAMIYRHIAMPGGWRLGIADEGARNLFGVPILQFSLPLTPNQEQARDTYHEALNYIKRNNLSSYLLNREIPTVSFLYQLS